MSTGRDERQNCGVGKIFPKIYVSTSNICTTPVDTQPGTLSRDTHSSQQHSLAVAQTPVIQPQAETDLSVIPAEVEDINN